MCRSKVIENLGVIPFDPSENKHSLFANHPVTFITFRAADYRIDMTFFRRHCRVFGFTKQNMSGDWQIITKQACWIIADQCHLFRFKQTPLDFRTVDGGNFIKHMAFQTHLTVVWVASIERNEIPLCACWFCFPKTPLHIFDLILIACFWLWSYISWLFTTLLNNFSLYQHTLWGGTSDVKSDCVWKLSTYLL